MKRFLLVLILALPVLADDLKPPASRAIPPAEKQALVESYRALEVANKDFQIAILKARIKAGVDETWPINLQTMEFEAPAAKLPQAPPAVEKKP